MTSSQGRMDDPVCTLSLHSYITTLLHRFSCTNTDTQGLENLKTSTVLLGGG